MVDGKTYKNVNPARAGMIPSRCPWGRLFRSKPRASGDDPLLEEGAHGVSV